MKLVDTLTAINQTLINVSKLTDVFTSKKDQKKQEEEIQKKVNEEFNRKLNHSKDTSFCDAVRKEKQKVIEELQHENE